MQTYNLKILFGPLFGCELDLPANDYFLVIKPRQSFENTKMLPDSSVSVSYTKSMLYIPCDTPSPNIILYLSKAIQGQGVGVDIIEDGNNHSITLKENELFSHGHIHFAIKRSDDAWPNSILFFTGSKETLLPTSKKSVPNGFKLIKRGIIIMILLISLVALLIYILHANKDGNRQLLSLRDALSGAPVPLDVVYSRDNKVIYVVSTQFQDFEWARGAVLKTQESKRVILVWLDQQNKDVIAQLNNSNYPILQINNTYLQQPTLSVYRALTAKEETDIKAIVLKCIPYALSVNIIVKKKNDLLTESREGLERLHIDYHLVTTSKNYAFVIHTNLSDENIHSLQYFINDFYRRWGNNIVTFSVDLNESWLKDKSYLNSNNGYILLNTNHWAFPSNNGNLENE